MKMENYIEENCKELEALGQYYRNDWSFVDGRTIRGELEDIARNLRNKTYNNYCRDLLKEQLEDL